MIIVVMMMMMMMIVIHTYIPPKQCTKTPPFSIPASMKIFVVGIQANIFDVSL